jgi:hypothetical protein
MRHRERGRHRKVVAVGMRERWSDWGLELDMLIGFVGWDNCVITGC